MSATQPKIDIEQIIKNSLNSTEFTKFLIKIDNNEETPFHVGANIIFPKVITVNKNGESDTVHLAIKIGKVRTSSNIHSRRESYFFDKIIPTFLTFQKEKNVQHPFQNFPKCYKTLLSDGYEVIVLENLKSRGYEMLRGVSASETSHRLMLKELARFHALSFALKHSKKEDFEILTENLKMPNEIFLTIMKDVFQNVLENIKTSLEYFKKLDELKKFEMLMGNYNGNSLVEMINNPPEEVVIVHGDYHKFNMMFKYQDEVSQDITDLTLIDFQVAGLHSPVLDFSYYYYSNGSLGLGDITQTSACLKYYYQELSSFSSELGIDIKDIFPYSTLLSHWKQYSFYGFCFMASLLVFRFKNLNNGKMEYTIKEEKDVAISFKDLIVDYKVENEDDYREALVKFAEAYLNYGINI